MAKLTLRKSIEVLSIFSIFSLAFGFLIWNFYLTKLGLAEFSVIQTKFILSGILFLLIAIILFFLYKAIDWKLGKHFSFLRSIKLPFHLDVVFFITFSIFLALFYSVKVFPMIPAEFGGGRPRLVSLVGSKEQIDFISNFGIIPASSVQTQNLCVAYENSEDITILLDNRVLSLKKDLIAGIGSLPGRTRDELLNRCGLLAWSWVNHGGEFIPNIKEQNLSVPN